MASSTPTFKFTYTDYRNAPDDKRYELLDGDLVVVPAPKEVHQRVLINLTILLGQLVRHTGVGHIYAAPFDVVLSDTDVVQPDLLFVSNERAHIITDENVQGAPDLVIEILSPSTAERGQDLQTLPLRQARCQGILAGGHRCQDGDGPGVGRTPFCGNRRLR